MCAVHGEGSFDPANKENVNAVTSLLCPHNPLILERWEAIRSASPNAVTISDAAEVTFVCGDFTALDWSDGEKCRCLLRLRICMNSTAARRQAIEAVSAGLLGIRQVAYLKSSPSVKLLQAHGSLEGLWRAPLMRCVPLLSSPLTPNPNSTTFHMTR